MAVSGSRERQADLRLYKHQVVTGLGDRNWYHARGQRNWKWGSFIFTRAFPAMAFAIAASIAAARSIHRRCKNCCFPHAALLVGIDWQLSQLVHRVLTAADRSAVKRRIKRAECQLHQLQRLCTMNTRLFVCYW